jgi:hypothetical protein
VGVNLYPFFSPFWCLSVGILASLLSPDAGFGCWAVCAGGIRSERVSEGGPHSEISAITVHTACHDHGTYDRLSSFHHDEHRVAWECVLHQCIIGLPLWEATSTACRPPAMAPAVIGNNCCSAMWS